MATNLGENKMCFHINLNQSNAKAMIFTHENSKRYGDYFLDFVNLNDFKDLGIDETFINIDTCSRFTYLTRSIKRFSDQVKLAKLQEEAALIEETYFGK